MPFLSPEGAKPTVDMLREKLSSATPQPQPYHSSDSLDATFQRLYESLQFARRIRVWSQSPLRQGSAVAGFIDARLQILENNLDALRHELHEMGSSIATSVPDRIGGISASVKRGVADLGELLDFYDRNREQERHDALDALFASQSILHIDGRRSCPRSLPNQQGLVKVAISIAETLGNTSLNGEPLVPQMEAVRSVVERQYVTTYVPYKPKGIEDTAQGSYGVVIGVEHSETSEELAMKTFKCNERSKILQEIGVLEVCNHPNIVKLVEAFTVANNGVVRLILRPWAPYTLENFLNSEDDKRKDRCRWFSPGSSQSDLCIYRIMKKLAQAVAHMNGMSIKHKDIKPDNILLHKPNSPDTHPLLTDVGVSKVYIRGGSTKFSDSSYSFLAPEQVKHLQSNLHADIWQLGCCFALMLGVAKRGKAGTEELGDSYCSTKHGRSCQIASEHEHFMTSLNALCDESRFAGEALSNRLAYKLVSRMLDTNHETRLKIHQVLSRLDRLVAQMNTYAMGDLGMSL
ncbi:serine threonine kinase [Fusarium subglutinans]|uniref:Serine threonine kinase n=1 Tax=Gibberella subglutinans TaxID=42677 RepID=A0A8H5Q263_GIBSU|nr:serine threonine kinase [Fusarium subglutinans]KAF5608080.1 serine threonine kinase [Fusarium subglutinans]